MIWQKAVNEIRVFRCFFRDLLDISAKIGFIPRFRMIFPRI
jgi:hypothetical protein